MNLRDYQNEAETCVFREWEENTSTLVVMPTGCGKTILFASIVQRMQPKRAMIIAHREELIFQAREKILRFAGLDCEIEMADLSASTSMFHQMPVVVSTVQTQSKRMERFNPNDFGLLVIDEAHHACADSYKKLVEYYKQNPALKILGVTATPDRADEEALGQIFETVAFDYEILDAIRDGYLVPIDQQMVNVNDLDFSSVRTTAGDLNGADLAAVMEAESAMQSVASASIEIIKDKRTIIFASSVKHAETICEILNRHKSGMAAWVSGKTPKEDRRKILSDFQNGKVQVVVNCAVLTEGFDNPGVEVIVMARPTKSRALYSQMAGRSTRPLPGVVDGLGSASERKAAIEGSAKKSALIVDFVGNSGRHKLMTSADVLGGKVSEEAIDRAIKTAKESGRAMRMNDLLEESEADIRAEVEQRKLQEMARRNRLVAKATFTTMAIDPFDLYQVTPERRRGWDEGKYLSEKQRAILTKANIDPDAISYSSAKKLIGAIIDRQQKNLCTAKQANMLKRFGYEPTNITFSDASKLIDAIASNGWKRPAESAKPKPEPSNQFAEVVEGFK